MDLELISTMATLLAAFGTLASLFYLALQIRLGNKLARAQVRQRMGEHSTGELYVLMNDAGLRDCFVAKRLTAEQQGRLHFFLLSAMRQREWEWFQLRDGIISEDVQSAYKAVIAIHLGNERTRRWWRKVGNVGFNPEFIAMVDAFLERTPMMTFFEDLRDFDRPDPPARAEIAAGA